MNQNLDNCPLLLNSKAHTTLKIGNFHIKNFLCKKLQSIKFWLQTKFSKTYWRHSLISGKKGKCIFKTCTIYDAINKTHSNNAFVMSQIYLLSLNLVCCNCSSNNKINWLHEQCQCILYNCKQANFEEIFSKITVPSLFTIRTSDF